MVAVTPVGPLGDRTSQRSMRTAIDSPPRARVVAVRDEPTTLAALVWAGLLGVVSAVLLLAMLIPGLEVGWLAGGGEVMTGVALLIPAWALFTWAFCKRTGELLLVSRRACVVLAIECLALGLWYRVEPLAGAAGQAGAVSSRTGLGLAEQLAGTPATVGLWVCLLGWLACRALSAPRQPMALADA